MISKIKDDLQDSILETFPVEFSVLDKNDDVFGWNKYKTRIFKRPEGVFSRNVRKYHLEISLAKVEQIQSDIKAGCQNKAKFWIDLVLGLKGEKHKIFIQYFTLRDKEDKYLRCLEASQDMTNIQKLSGEKRLLN